MNSLETLLYTVADLRYTTKACMKCPVKNECSKAKYGKAIQRSEYQEHINQNKKRIEKNKDYYRKRQAIVEHPYGTIKRQWGFNYIMTKKYIEHASADVELIFTAYDIRRLINIIGIDVLRDYMKSLLFLLMCTMRTLRVKTSHFKQLCFFCTFSILKLNSRSKWLSLICSL